MTWGKSAAELKRDGREEDLDFILRHLDDLDLVCRYEAAGVSAVSAKEDVTGRARGPVAPGLPAAPTAAAAPAIAP